MDDEERCPLPECELDFDHSGAHEDQEGFRWGGQEREDAKERAEDRFDIEAKAALRGRDWA